MQDEPKKNFSVSKYNKKNNYQDEDEKLLKKKSSVQKHSNIDFFTWKKKFSVPENTKVFIILGNYPELRKHLLEKGINNINFGLII